MFLMKVSCLIAFLGCVYSKHHFRICGKSNHNTSSGELLPHNGIIPAGHDCTWHIYPDSFNIPEVFMVIEDFKLEATDRFIISKHDGDKLFGPFSGHKDTFSILTGSLLLDVLVDTTNSPSTDRSFRSYFTTNDCYYLIEEASGVMASPLYKNTKRSKVVTCTWQFRKFKQVTLPRNVIFETFHLLNSTLVIKGSKAQDGIYSGTKLPKNIVAFGETQFILTLNTSIPDEIFSFRYGIGENTPTAKNSLLKLDGDETEVPTVTETESPTVTGTELHENLVGSHTACGNINLHGLNGWFGPKDDIIIASHTCLWTITAGLTEQSEGVYIFIERSHLFNDDQFVLRQSTVAGGRILFGPYYGNKGSFSVFMDERSVDAVLRTSDKEPFKKRNFKAYYSTEGCNYPITSNVGIIASPVYHKKDQGTTTCKWKFNQADEFAVMSISFDTYNIKSSSFQIEGSINQDKSYKGSDGPFDILMKKNGELTLEIDRTVENETFTFSYNTLTPECTNYIRIIGKESTSVSFPPSGPHNISAFNCQWIIEGNDKSVLAIHFDEIHLADVQDLLQIKDGKTRTSPTLMEVTQISQGTTEGSFVVSNTNVIWISFSTRFPFKSPRFQMKVNISEQGGHLHSGQNFTIAAPKSGMDVIFFLEVEENEQVLLNLLPEQKLPANGIILAYNGFSVKGSLLTEIKYNKPFYPIVSTGSKMMIIGRGFDKNSSVKLGFEGVAKGCHQVSLDLHGTYSVSGNCNRTCSWAILPKSNDTEEMLSLHLSSVALRPSDIVDVYRLDDNMTHIAKITLKENHMPNMYLPASYGAYINITRSSCIAESVHSAAFSASAQVLRGCSTNIEVKAGESIYISSPNYPDLYPLFSHCYWNISTSSKNLYISFEKFQLASGHCLKIHNINDGKLQDTFTYSSSVVPNDKMLQNDISFELVANECTKTNETNPSPSGNGFLVKIFALDCGGVLGKQMKGAFNTPDFPQPVTEDLLCIWNLEIPKHNSDGSVNIISFDIQWSSASTDEQRGLTIHDGPSLKSEVFTNTSTETELFSKTNTLVFMYEKTHSAVKINFESRAGNVLCDNGIYMHPDWVCNGIDECGDYSDEKNCKGRAPQPPPVPPSISVTKSGVSPTVFWSLVPTMFVVGILSTIVTAIVITEVRKRRQNYDTLPILP